MGTAQASSLLKGKPMANETLLKRLVTVYLGTDIAYPHLRAITLAQWLLESSNGTSKLAKDHYNFGGLKWRPEMKSYAKRIRYDAHDGIDYYCKFPTIDSFVRGYWAFLDRSPYSGWEEHVANATEFIAFIGPIYCPNKGYVPKVLGLLDKANQLLASAQSLEVRHHPNSAASIVIDPGHGGTTQLPGSSPNNAISVSGVKEKALTLEFALLLEQALNALGNEVNVTLTRREDRNLEGSQRAELARNADLFLSIHFNGDGGLARGTEAFYRAASNGNIHTAKDMAFAEAVVGAVYGAVAQIDPKAKNRGIKPDTQTKVGRLAVLSRQSLGSRPQACLLEVEFIDHVAVDKLLVSGPAAVANKTFIAQELAKALIERAGRG